MVTDATKFKFLPLTLSTGTLGGLSAPLVRRGTPLPTKRQQRFSTAVDNQTTVIIEVYLGESRIVAKNIRVGKVELVGIPEAPRGEPEIDITLEVDEQCKIKVTATEKKSGKVISSQVENAIIHLTAETVQEMLRKANDSLREDEALAQQIEAKNNTNSLIHRAEKYLQDHHTYGLDNSTDKQIEETLASLGLSLQENDLRAIEEKSRRLEQLLPGTTSGNLANFYDMFSFLSSPTARKQPATQPTSNTSKKSNATGASGKGQAGQTEEMEESKKGLYSAGQHFDAKRLVRDLFAQAIHEIIVIDAYIGEDVLSLLTVKRDAVQVKLLTDKVSSALLTLSRDFLRQYKGLEIRSSKAFHDRFIVIDTKDFYHFGASLEHLGNKTFLFSKLEEPQVVAALQKQWTLAWGQAAKIL